MNNTHTHTNTRSSSDQIKQTMKNPTVTKILKRLIQSLNTGGDGGRHHTTGSTSTGSENTIMFFYKINTDIEENVVDEAKVSTDVSLKILMFVSRRQIKTTVH